MVTLRLTLKVPRKAPVDYILEKVKEILTGEEELEITIVKEVEVR